MAAPPTTGPDAARHPPHARGARVQLVWAYGQHVRQYETSALGAVLGVAVFVAATHTLLTAWRDDNAPADTE